MNKALSLTLIMALIALPLLSQEQPDSLQANKKSERIKTGWSFGGVPAIAYDSDRYWLQI